MNGRIERIDARYALNSEMNYSVIVDELKADRKRRIRRRIEGALAIAAVLGWLWLVIWKVAQGIR